jgi:diguanylate cyclase (GGDEF)-like protein/PAS domain S-box-containing protein
MGAHDEVIVVETGSELRELAARVLASSRAAIVITNARSAGNPVIFANQAFCQMTGYATEEILGRKGGFLSNGQADQPESETLSRALHQMEAADVVVPGYRKDGSQFWSHCILWPVTDANGDISHFVSTLTDVTEFKLAEDRLNFQTSHDPLTGLANRQAFLAHVESSLRRIEPQQRAAVLTIEIDHFKKLKHTIGYAGTDTLLQTIAGRLQAIAGASDGLSRNDAAEFAVLIDAVDSLVDVAAVCGSVHEALCAPFTIDGAKYHLSCSIGVTFFPQDGADATTLLQHAGIALRRARELGDGGIQYFSQELEERILERIALEARLREAIERDELELHYQPVVNLRTGEVSGLEALCRWTDPELGAIPPSRFVAVAEESGLIEQLGQWALKQACHDMRTWRDNGLGDIRVAVNVSPRQFRDPALAQRVEAALAACQVAPHMLSLEITETVLMQDTPASAATLEKLKALGIELVLDDFGTGYSSLSYLKRFPFDKVKIDRTFVENVVADTGDTAIAKAIISMAHSLGIRVVAEGVETEAQCEFLQQEKCDEIQGFLFSQALPAVEVGTLMQQHRQLPAHLLHGDEAKRTLLLVDDEANILSSLKRLLREDGYHILTANGGQEGLLLLGANDVDVILSDQRMPNMTGVEFLHKAKELYPHTVRMVLSGYTELQSVTDAVNEGAIYKFLTKPWDDTQLRSHVAEAFRIKKMSDENQRLSSELRSANLELAMANRRLEVVLRQQQQQITRDEISLDVIREALLHVPVPVIAMDEDDVVAFVNGAAQEILGNGAALLGCDAAIAIPALYGAAEARSTQVELEGTSYSLFCQEMGRGSQSRGRLITLTPTLQEKS